MSNFLAPSLKKTQTGLCSAWTHPTVSMVSPKPEAPVPLGWGWWWSQGGGSPPTSWCCCKSVVKMQQQSWVQTAEKYSLLPTELKCKVKVRTKDCGSQALPRLLFLQNIPCAPWVIPCCYLSKSLSQQDILLWLTNKTPKPGKTWVTEKGGGRWTLTFIMYFHSQIHFLTQHPNVFSGLTTS